jgi:hypothetical protein
MVTAMVVKDIIYGPWPSVRRDNIAAFRKLSDRHCQNNFRGCDCLPHVPLSMVGDVDQQSCDRRGQLPLAHDPDLLECAHVERLNPEHAVREGGTQFREKGGPGRSCIHLGFQCSELLFIQVSPRGVGEQAIQTSRYMAQVKGHRRQSAGSRIDLFVAQTAAPALQVFSRKFQRMHDRALHGGNFLQRAPQPWLW